MAKVEFGGRIGRDWRDSEPWWPPDPSPPDGAPNVVLVVLDDVGFAQLGCYGSDIATPTIDGLAAGGVRLTNFHTTALCSPTRACLLTGRNHHRSGMGRVADLAIGLPGLLGQAAQGERVPVRDPAAARLRHLRRGEVAPHPRGRDAHGAPRARRGPWPGASTAGTASTAARPTSSSPPSTTTTTRVRPPRSIEEGYHLSADLADRAIEFLGDLRAVDADQPFFLYFCTGACHSPHHAPRSMDRRATGATSTTAGTRWRERDLRPPARPRGDPPRHRALAAPAVGAGLGRPRRRRADGGEPASWSASPPSSPTPTRRSAGCSPSSRRPATRDNTVVILVSDNGASSEGGPEGSINDIRLSNFDPGRAGRDVPAHRRDRRAPHPQQLPVGLDHGGQHPVQALEARGPRGRRRRSLHRRRWPARLAAGAGGIRHQFAHAVDVLPTVLELVGIEAPAEIEYVPQTPIDGISFAYLLGRRRGGGTGAARSPSTSRCSGPGPSTTTGGRRSPSTRSDRSTTTASTRTPRSTRTRGSSTTWPRTCPRSHDLAAEHPERVADMVERGGRRPGATRCCRSTTGCCRRWSPNPRPHGRRDRTSFRYFPGGAQVPEPVAVNVRNRSHAIEVEVDVPDGVVPDGVLLALGSALGGWSLHVLDGRLRYVHNLYGKERHVIEADAVLAPGPHTLALHLRQGRPARRNEGPSWSTGWAWPRVPSSASRRRASTASGSG